MASRKEDASISTSKCSHIPQRFVGHSTHNRRTSSGNWSEAQPFSQYFQIILAGSQSQHKSRNALHLFHSLRIWLGIRRSLRQFQIGVVETCNVDLTANATEYLGRKATSICCEDGMASTFFVLSGPPRRAHNQRMACQLRYRDAGL